VVFQADCAIARRIDRQTGGLVEHDRFAIDEQDAVGEHGLAL
jgi:hypothetical protein